MGWLVAASPKSEREAGIGDFRENGENFSIPIFCPFTIHFFGSGNFLNLLHKVVSEVLDERSDERLNAGAVMLGEGWMHINGELLNLSSYPY